MNVVWTDFAFERVRGIAEEMAADHPRAAAAWTAATLGLVARLAAFPESGRVVPELQRREIREVLSGSYRVVYRVELERVVVLTVRHQRQSTSKEDLPDGAG